MNVCCARRLASSSSREQVDAARRGRRRRSSARARRSARRRGSAARSVVEDLAQQALRRGRACRSRRADGRSRAAARGRRPRSPAASSTSTAACADLGMEVVVEGVGPEDARACRRVGVGPRGAEPVAERLRARSAAASRCGAMPPSRLSDVARERAPASSGVGEPRRVRGQRAPTSRSAPSRRRCAAAGGRA